MCEYRLLRCTSMSAIAVAIVALLSIVTTCDAGIVLPQQIGFEEKDLENALDDAKTGRASSTSSNSQEWPTKDRGNNQNPSELLKSPIPLGNSSSSSSSSSVGGAAGSGVVLCLFSNTITIADDSSLGRLPEDHGLSLPDPPGTDLLRPPRYTY